MSHDFNEQREFIGALLRSPEIGDLRTLNFARTALFTAILWTQIAAMWYLASIGTWLSVGAAVLLSTGVMQGLLTWVHEASHLNISRNREFNDRWANLFFAGPLGITVETYRQSHFTHHNALSTERDADRSAYDFRFSRPRDLLKFTATMLLGIDGLRRVAGKYMPGSRSHDSVAKPPQSIFGFFAIVFWQCTFLGASFALGKPWLYFVIWLGPLLTIAMLLNSVRSIAEHQPDGYGYDAAQMLPTVRTTTPNPMEKWLLYQANFNYHLEHHLLPQIPAHNLPKLHSLLRDAGFYAAYPDTLQRSGIARFLTIAAGNGK